jgi:chromosome segregation ATPase
MEHQLASAAAGKHRAVGIAQLSGGQRTLLYLALILAVKVLFCT